MSPAVTTAAVPAVLVAAGFEATQLRAGGVLADVAPTLLKLFGAAEFLQLAFNGFDVLRQCPECLYFMAQLQESLWVRYRYNFQFLPDFLHGRRGYIQSDLFL